MPGADLEAGLHHPLRHTPYKPTLTFLDRRQEEKGQRVLPPSHLPVLVSEWGAVEFVSQVAPIGHEAVHWGLETGAVVGWKVPLHPPETLAKASRPSIWQCAATLVAMTSDNSGICFNSHLIRTTFSHQNVTTQSAFRRSSQSRYHCPEDYGGCQACRRMWTGRSKRPAASSNLPTTSLDNSTSFPRAFGKPFRFSTPPTAQARLYVTWRSQTSPPVGGSPLRSA